VWQRAAARLGGPVTGAGASGRLAPGLTLRQAVVADLPAIWAVRYAVTENTLTLGRLSDEDVRREIEDSGRGWVIVKGGVEGGVEGRVEEGVGEGVDEGVHEGVDDCARTGSDGGAAGAVVQAFAIGNARSGNVWALFVTPLAQGRGCGHALHAVMVDWLRAQHAPTLWLTTGADTRACRFYERRGWQRVGLSASGEVRYELPGAP